MRLLFQHRWFVFHQWVWSLSHGIVFLSIAVSTTERQCSREAAFFHAYSKDRCSVVSDPIQRLWAKCGWVFLEVVSSLMEACDLQQQLHGDGLHQEQCMRCGHSLKCHSVAMLESGVCCFVNQAPPSLRVSFLIRFDSLMYARKPTEASLIYCTE